MARYTLLDGVTADTNGSGIEISVRQLGVWVLGDDFGGGTVSIQFSPDSGQNWVTPENATFTSSTLETFDHDASAMVRAVLSGSTSPSAVTVLVDEGSN